MMASGDAVTIIITADGTNYKVPASAPTVTGATSSWVRNSDTSATLTLSNPVSNVSFTVAGEAVVTYTLTSTDDDCSELKLSINGEYKGCGTFTIKQGDVLSGTATRTGTSSRTIGIFLEVDGTTYSGLSSPVRLSIPAQNITLNTWTCVATYNGNITYTINIT